MDASIFTDSQGRDWALAFTIASAKAIKQRTKLDFVNIWDGNALESVGTSDESLSQVLWLLCQKQAAERNVKEEDFLDSLTGDVMESAGMALEEAVILFCRPARRPALRAALEQSRKAMGQASQAAESKIQGEKFGQVVAMKLAEADAAMEAKLDSLLTSGQPSGDSLAASA